VDTAFVGFLCDAQDRAGAEAFCQDKTNLCALDRSVTRLVAATFELAAVHLKSTRRAPKASVDDLLEAYQRLKQPQFFSDLALRSSSVRRFVPWILVHCAFPSLIVLCRLFGAEIAQVPELERLVCNSVSRPRLLLACVAQVVFDNNTGGSPTAFAQSTVLAMEEAVEHNDETFDSEAWRVAVRSNLGLAKASVDLLDASKHRVEFAHARVACFRALGKHREALRILVEDVHDFQAAERYCGEAKTEKASQEGWFYIIMM
jgi:hypothetical protein